MPVDQKMYVGKPNYDGYIAIGAGLPRTGTASMRSALRNQTWICSLNLKKQEVENDLQSAEFSLS